MLEHFTQLTILIIFFIILKERGIYMKLKWALFTAILTIVAVLTGCEPLMVLDPKGPQAERQASDIYVINWNYVVYRYCCFCYFSICVN